MRDMRPDHALLIRTKSLDPWRNLAVEEYFLSRVDQSGPILMLWQSDRTVVIGKNQNPWQECNLRALRQDGCRLARRSSGGGSVYHDIGNLNFALITRRESHDLLQSFGVILLALENLGIRAARSGRNSLFAGDKKISGNAFCFKRTAAMHHGTLLIDADLERLHRYLTPPPAEIRSHAIPSVRDEVMNLRSLRKDLSVDEMASALGEAFRQDQRGRVETLSEADLPEDILQKEYLRLTSWDWVYGMSPTFNIELKHAANGHETIMKSTKATLPPHFTPTDANPSAKLFVPP
jgi:lipoate-protein ligase A